MASPGRRSRKEHVIAHRIFVGNLSFDVAQAELEDLFAQVGEVVDVSLPLDRATGRPRGFAFVEYRDAAGGAAAIARFDGYELRDRTLRVNEAEDRRPPAGTRPTDAPRFPPPRGKSKGSRRNLRARKRSL